VTDYSRFQQWTGLWHKGKPYINSFANWKEMKRIGYENSEVHFNQLGWAYYDATKVERQELRRRAVRLLNDEGWHKSAPMWTTMRNMIIAFLYKRMEQKRTNNYAFGTLYRKGKDHQWVNFKTVEGIVDGTGKQRHLEKGQINYPAV
jgi:hypothetical protein